jgi:hypothetical protein
MIELADTFRRGQYQHHSHDGQFTFTHEGAGSTLWIVSANVDPLRRFGQTCSSLKEARRLALTDGFWAGVHTDVAAVLARRPLPTVDGGTDHDRANAALAWLTEHHPHPLTEPTHRCECGAPIAYVAGRWGHTSIVCCPTAQPMPCLCAHRYRCDEPVPYPGRPCAFATEGRRCCGGCWEREV